MCGAMYYTEDMPASTITIPPNVEQVVLLRGPALLAELVRLAGGVSKASSAAGVARITLTRWMRTGERPSGFCSPGTADHHSLWAGYPPPLPGLDRVVEVLLDKEPSSFLSEIEKRRPGAAEAFAIGTPMSLREICSDDSRIREAMKIAQIPRTTAQRMLDGVEYPSAWRSLDGLSLHVHRQRWLESVLSCDPRALTAKIPPRGLLALLECLGVSGLFTR